MTPKPPPGTGENGWALASAASVEHSSTGSRDYRKRGVYGLPAFDSATVRVDAGGNVLAAVSARSTGQGHESVFAGLVARELGVRRDTVRVLEGDTDAVPFGAGTGVSRSAVSTGGAIRLAVQDIKRNAIEIARFFLETEAEELAVADGEIFVTADPSPRVSFAAVAAAAHGRLPGGLPSGERRTRPAVHPVLRPRPTRPSATAPTWRW